MEKIFKEYYKEVIPHTYNDDKNLEKLFGKIIDNMLIDKQKQDKPNFVHMLGIPGAGKTTFLRKNIDKFKDYLLLDFDNLMEQLPEYRQDINEIGLVKSFKKWQIPARIAGYELLLRAVANKVNIFFDHGGSPFLHVKLLEEIKKNKYYIKVIYIKCNTDIAIIRTKEREKYTLRHTPEELIVQREPLIKQRIKQFREIADEFIEIDNN